MKRVTFSDDSARCSPTLVKRRRFSHAQASDDDDTPCAREDLSRNNISDRLIDAYGGWYHGIYRALVKRELPRDVERIRAKLLSPRDHFTDDHIGDDGYLPPELVRRVIENYVVHMRYARNDRYYDTVFNPKP